MAKTCKTCGWLKDSVSVEQLPPDWSQELPDEVNDLDKVAGTVHRCPTCGAFFGFQRKKGANQHMGSTFEIMRRLSVTQALDGLLATDYNGPLIPELQAALKA